MAISKHGGRSSGKINTLALQRRLALQYDPAVIESAWAAFDDAPAAYAMDWGVTDDGRTLLVEVNEGYSVGAYGLYFTDYARFLSARWAQLTGTTGLCAFDLPGIAGTEKGSTP